MMTPIAEIVGGSLRWHVPHAAYAVPVEYLRGSHMLYAADAPQMDQARTEQPARKVGGSYQADGWIVARFTTRSGAQRVVFEFVEPAGMLHIFSVEQVERRLPKEQS